MKRNVVYDDHVMNCLGKLTTEIELEEKFLVPDLIVIDSETPFGLWGRDLISSDNSIALNQVNPANCPKPSNYLPTIKGVTAKMELIKDLPNVFCKARTLPLALQDEVAGALDKLENAGM